MANPFLKTADEVEHVQKRKEATKSSWTPDEAQQYGAYGTGVYERIDPTTIHPEDFMESALSELKGDEKHKGEVREYLVGENEPNPETDMKLDWLARIGTVFTTDLEGFVGEWVVVRMPVIREHEVLTRAARRDDEKNIVESTMVEISAIGLGLQVGKDHHYQQTISKLVERGVIDRCQKALM